MQQVFLYLHVLGAILMGFYLMLPFLAMRVEALQSGTAQFGFLNVLFAANRAGQLALVIAFLSGGYLVSKAPYSVLWMVLAVVLFLAIGALTGILGSKMRKALQDPSGGNIKAHIGSIKSLSVINGIIFFLVVTLMKFPYAF
ncbi:hypothetical protein YDYSG_11530 [Paenibacillus tyrfis]|uniref:hypothetical protein n=1 Tax=Paenibacillus TaxID=44249 RepID=UPI0024900D94|nr:hypothetical protein [Paenibacillus tyrfis]GLI05123.1 hypothetical protein YDYSG_11530 [Paenibacillus tyrfis]GMX63890.1 hypothetical protein Elgi_33000 [Paenibacillus elgii]